MLIYFIIFFFVALNINQLFSEKQSIYFETRDVSPFNSIIFGCLENYKLPKYHNISPENFSLIIKQSDIYSLNIIGINKEVKLIVTKVVSNILYIGYANEDVILINGIVIRIMLPDIKTINVVNGGKVISDGRLYLNEVSIETLNNSTIMMNIEANKVKLIYKGFRNGIFDMLLNVKELETYLIGKDGFFKLAGFTLTHQIDSPGKGEIKALDLFTLTNIINISGICSCELNVSNYLETMVTGTGEINYKGTPLINRKKSWDRAIIKKII